MARAARTESSNKNIDENPIIGTAFEPNRILLIQTGPPMTCHGRLSDCLLIVCSLFES